MRRRRGGFRSGSGFKKRERAWITKHFPPTGHLVSEIAFFELLEPIDYLEGDNVTKSDHATLLRTVGRCEFDVAVGGTPSNVSVTIYAALIVASEIAVQNAVFVDGGLAYHPANTAMPVRSRVLREFMPHNFTSTWSLNTGNVDQLWFTGMHSDPAIEWDVKQKVKMNNDDALWFVAACSTTTDADWFSLMRTRQLFAD